MASVKIVISSSGEVDDLKGTFGASYALLCDT